MDPVKGKEIKMTAIPSMMAFFICAIGHRFFLGDL
jgi:hypothetical protein